VPGLSPSVAHQTSVMRRHLRTRARSVNTRVLAMVAPEPYNKIAKMAAEAASSLIHSLVFRSSRLPRS
jgi:hypothetical protein